ncbi:MAG: hypothetical protein ACJASQ_003148 [Crocinitomicaceae bacterium]|jgi:hypothetical protein
MKDHHFKNELKLIVFDKIYSEDDSKLIMKGFNAPTMDDKWDVIYKNEELGVFRSWTGIGMFKLRFENQDGRLHIIEAYCDEKFLNDHSPEYCSALLNWVVEFVVFGRRADLPKWDY